MRKLILSTVSLFYTGVAMALPGAISSPAPVGNASFSLLGVPLYSAVLYTENGAGYSPSAPFILELTYKRNISRDRLVDATVKEMTRIYGGAGGVDGQLSQCFRDVAKGDRFAAVNVGANAVDFYFNDQKTCTLSGSGVSQKFFGIWLSDSSRDPSGTKALRGN